MRHMPYERMQVGDEAEEGSDTRTERRAAEVDEPGRTPKSAEGLERSERKGPVEEPGRTPGSAEGE